MQSELARGFVALGLISFCLFDTNNSDKRIIRETISHFFLVHNEANNVKQCEPLYHGLLCFIRVIQNQVE